MNKTDDFKVYTFEEVLDDIYGIDTPERKRFEKYCDEEMRKEEERMHRVNIPNALYTRIKEMATDAGQSVNAFVQQTLSSALAPA